MGMVPVMMKTTMRHAFLTVEIAVEFTSLQIGAQNVIALKKAAEETMEE
jgi:hypothetical protein